MAKRFLIVGAGRGGTALLKALLTIEWVSIVSITDINLEAPGIQFAKENQIPYASSYEPFIFSEEIDVILEATGNSTVYHDLERKKTLSTILIPGTVANIVMSLIEQKERLIHQLEQKSQELNTFLNSTHDAIVAVNSQGVITLFNRSAERILDVKREEVVGTEAKDTIPNTRLHHVLQTGESELNREQALTSNKRIITNRVAVSDNQGNIIGAVAVFRDITEVLSLAEEITDLKGVQTFLEAIINSSEDAISVVDALGNGMLINPAYTRLTGLSPEDILGKPADVDISEGESMHLKVLQTRKPVRGAHMKVGPKKKDVIVNVAPVVVDGTLKGSVGVIHDVTEFKKLAEELERAKRIIRTLEAKYTFQDIMGFSDTMLVAVDQAQKAAMTPATVLLRGESGTGKELFAHAIHNESSRKYSQFLRVNCAAITDQLLESELFGYEEGAFTGAKKGGKRGLFEEASGGTIFLDEIGEMSVNTQAKLLRVLQEKEIIRVGGTKSIPIDVRIIAATHVNLEKAIQQGHFREDLYYRLNMMPIMIPPLRYRKEDILPLSLHLIRKFNQEYGRAVEDLHADTLEILQSYDWPGNVRELENVVGRSIINMRFTETRILPHHLPSLITKPLAESSPPRSARIEQTQSNQTGKLSEILEAVEKNVIYKVFEESGRNKTQTAKRLGLSIRSLYYKMEKYKLN
ncbi:sigma-54-dependent Fis family transcriptional regulator [Ammoniphilus sp. CFH 90114]|uniref:sigma-54 interaction domain-containing protein n=1 Tax=Ammoniphilus sp. CFH 90114 TaxID=2493665 RepID=UPI00100F5305|nr:sigma-54-dependent Fis family transcriptional regulator [Ammoniphilus sp. CFH 90114]RXT13810.1 PAS domain S-box protein [Ammoniphilus sp. CFH 90114]